MTCCALLRGVALLHWRVPGLQLWTTQTLMVQRNRGNCVICPTNLRLFILINQHQLKQLPGRYGNWEVYI